MRSKLQCGSISQTTSTARALVVFLLMVVATQLAQAQTYSVLYTFSGGSDGANPYAGLVRDAAGNLYGTTIMGGTAKVGTVFKVSKGGKETLLHTFLGHPDGAYPQAGLLRDAAGNLYGTTSIGGSHQCGTVFRLDTTGKETVLYNFCSVTRAEDGRNPHAGLIRDAAGNLYGTTLYGGSTACVWGNRGCGVVFKLDTTGKETVLYNFCSEKNCTDGAVPYAGLVRDEAGNLYGTTYLGGSGGGSNNGGVVFKLDTNGKETVLHSFCPEKNCTDGANPTAGLIRDAAGNLYGTATVGGVGGCGEYSPCGVVFKVDTTGKETVLYNFCSEKNCTDGGAPYASLIRDAAGNLYGTTEFGGATGFGCGTGCGVVFKLDTTGHETVLYAFTYGADGLAPLSRLIRDAVGNLYGTTSDGGDPSCLYAGCGVVFKLTP